MNAATALLDTFGTPKVVLPVIHVRETGETLRNLDVVAGAGAHGAFLIDHDAGDPAWLFELTGTVRREHPDLWLGLNLLGLPAPVAVSLLHPVLTDTRIDGLWTDNAGIDERATHQGFAERVDEARAATGWSGLYFGGVAFKYQRPVADLAAATRAARTHMDVITTSGPGTGRSADVDKLARMHAAADGHPLGIASGITPDNVDAFLPYVDAFLVATGISRTFHELDPAATNDLVAAVRSA